MDAESDKIYAAEKIVRKRPKRGQVEYFVKWKGWSHRHNTWEPVKNILDRRLIEAFELEDSKSKQKEVKKSPRTVSRSASNDDSLNDKSNGNSGEVENSTDEYLTKSKTNSKLQTSTANGSSNGLKRGKRKSFPDSDTAESSSSSTCSRTSKNDGSSSTTSSQSSRSSRVDDLRSSRRRRKLSATAVDGKENSDAKRKVQILSKLFPKDASKQDASGSRILKQCSSNRKDSLLSDEALHAIKKVSERDCCDIFGEYVATEMRKYNERTRSIVQHLIHNILFDADMGKHGEISTLKYENVNDVSTFSDDKYSPSKNSTVDNSSLVQSPPKTSHINETPVHHTNISSTSTSQKRDILLMKLESIGGSYTDEAMDGGNNTSVLLKPSITSATTNSNAQATCRSPSKKVTSPSAPETAK